MNLDRFNRDHVVLMQKVTDLRNLAKTGIAERATDIVRELSALGAIVKVHLAAEDRALYPALVAHAGTREIAERYQREMGSLAAAFGEFMSRWTVARRIAEDPEGFRAHANSVFKALHDRIQHENRELYPLAAEIREVAAA